jgi:ubiquinone biosynthesis monooxygenase Coq7
MSTASRPKQTAEHRLPGDPDRSETIARMVRVNHAGEYGAKRIYEGQLAILAGTKDEPLLRDMLDQELVHLDHFEKELADRHVRPTLLQPLWHVAGFALGAGTALLGREAAMACTVAVEEVIDKHYTAQADQLGDDEADLRATIEDFRDDERQHRAMGIEEGAEQAPAYPILTGAIKAGSKLAIWLSTRL